MSGYRELAVSLASFVVIVLASGQIGRLFAKIRLPLISGFLFAGILAGPYVLDLISAEAMTSLRFLEEGALGFIAFAAGSELYLREMRGRFRAIRWVTIGLVAMTFTLGTAAVVLLGDNVPVTRGLPTSSRVAMALLAGSILVAISPSSAIAIVNELRAKGPFTKVALGVTIILDLVVIVLFAINSQAADALLTGLPINISFVALLLAELALAILLGFVVGSLLNLVLSLRLDRRLKALLVLLAGYGVFVFSFFVRDLSHARLPFELFFEPLLVCMIAGFIVANRSPFRNEFLRVLNDIGPVVYVFFFTFTGAALQIDILATIWRVALILFIARLVGISIGSFAGGLVAGEPMAHNRIRWMAFVTQAGVGLGLAREAAVEYPEFGAAFATMMISVIVLNQIVGPPFFKTAIRRVGEAHTRGTPEEGEHAHRAVIFGVDDQSLALVRLLESHGWQALLICREASYRDALSESGVEVKLFPELEAEALRQLEVDKADVIVAMLDDQENLNICQLAYEAFGTKTLVARLSDLASRSRFQRLGVLTVHPSTAIVSLLDHVARSPSTASLLLSLNSDQDIVDVEVRDPNIDGMALRDLRLPLDTLVLSVQRDGHSIITHGYTRLKLKDSVTVLGSPASLDQVIVRFEE
jgi:Trk K+ transport system NAD-binding subunit/Kef-type K+ transport system membrane component KefB